MIVYAGPALLVRLLVPARTGPDWGAALRDFAEVQVVSTPLAVAECSAEAVLAGLEQGMTVECVLDRLSTLVDPVDGLVELVDLEPVEMEARATKFAANGLALGHARHLAAAELCFRDLAEPGEKLAFGADDGRQARVATACGWHVL
ncbi:MAG: hypothetical protein LH475_13235 [Cryobacterium sp.]|uniref:hypothetical protein n=1 Tax=unclassified Cryobacterium TaxID=2649013 RepID=UPI0018C902DD|nr:MULTISPECIES: hypothetical protein [unclassified Cryobacterium]MCY7405563.1 hypothetical protein [Cryobacterium sp.]MEC5154452.1 hypothetical protein [Cryobacterium sp. CAN_C3]